MPTATVIVILKPEELKHCLDARPAAQLHANKLPTQKEIFLSVLKAAGHWTFWIAVCLLAWVGLSHVLDNVFK